MWSKLGSVYAQHWWVQESEKETGGERRAFKAALWSSSLGKFPAKPCYPEETILSATDLCAENSFCIENCLDGCYVSPNERSANRFIGEGKEGDLSAS